MTTTTDQFLALGPNCWAFGSTADAARKKAKKYASQGTKIAEIGAYRLPAGSTATVDSMGRVECGGGTPEHVSGPETIDWIKTA